MALILLGVFLVIQAAVVLFSIVIDPKLVAVLELIVGLVLIIAPYAGRYFPHAPNL